MSKKFKLLISLTCLTVFIILLGACTAASPNIYVPGSPSTHMYPEITSILGNTDLPYTENPFCINSGFSTKESMLIFNNRDSTENHAFAYEIKYEGAQYIITPSLTLPYSYCVSGSLVTNSGDILLGCYHRNSSDKIDNRIKIFHIKLKTGSTKPQILAQKYI